MRNDIFLLKLSSTTTMTTYFLMSIICKFVKILKNFTDDGGEDKNANQITGNGENISVRQTQKVV